MQEQAGVASAKHIGWAGQLAASWAQKEAGREEESATELEHGLASCGAGRKDSSASAYQGASCAGIVASA